MINAMAYDSDSKRAIGLRSVMHALMGSFGSNSHGVTCLSSVDELESGVFARRQNAVEIIVCRIASADDPALQAIKNIAADSPDTGIIVLAESPELVGPALSAGAEGFSLVSDGADGLKKAMAPIMTRIMRRHSEMVGLKCDTGVRNIPVDDIVFAESAKKGSLLHMSNGETILVRSTLQVLSARLESKGAFFKAGSSFVVNIANMRSTAAGAIIFANGDSIVVPVRMRKLVSDAFEGYLKRPA